MTVLSLAASQHTNLLRVDAPLSNPTYPVFYDLGMETVKVTDGADTTEWQVERGVADTQAARHIRGTLLVANASPYGGGGGGGVSVDNGVDPPASVDTINVAGATVVGSTATLLIPRVIIATFDFDDPLDINGYWTFAESALPQGSIVTRVGAIPTIAFALSGGDTPGDILQVGVGVGNGLDQGNNGESLVTYDGAAVTGWGPYQGTAFEVQYELGTSGHSAPWAAILSDGAGSCFVWPGFTNPMSAGRLIAFVEFTTPSS